MQVVIAGPADPSGVLPTAPGTVHPRGHGGQGAGVVHDLAAKLVGAGLDVTVVSLSEHVNQTWTHKVGSAEMVLVPMRASGRRRLADFYRTERVRLRAAIADLSFSVLHAHWTYAYAHAALSVDRKALINLHDSPWRLFRLTPSLGLAALSTQTFWTARRARNVVASSPYVGDTWVRDFRGAPPRAVLPNLAPDLTGCVIADQHHQQVVSLGHPHPNKNLSSLIRAWPTIQDAVPRARLTVTGAGTEAGGSFDLAHGASDLGIQMLGRASRQELLKLLGRSSVMVHPSMSEACPMSIVEAMTLAMPSVVGKQAGPMQWMIGSGGRVVDVKDPDAIAAATIELLTDATAYGEASQGALNASKKFSPAVLMPQWLGLYESLAKERDR